MKYITKILIGYKDGRHHQIEDVHESAQDAIAFNQASRDYIALAIKDGGFMRIKDHFINIQELQYITLIETEEQEICK